MLRKVVCLGFLLAGVGCSWFGGNSGVITLNNEEFTARTLMGTPFVDTNELAGVEGIDTNMVAEASLKSRLIIPGVSLMITVEEDASLNREYLVSPGGAIDYPPLGRIMVEGITGEELEQNIKQRLEKDYFRQATVHVKVDRAVGGGIIYVLGSVGRPGPIQLPMNEKFTVLKAMLAAGGGGAFGNTAKIKVIRYGEDGRKYQTFVNLDRIQSRAEFEKDIPLVNGDWLIVPEKIVNF